MSHLKVQPLVSYDRISCTHIQTTEMVIIKNTIDYSSAKFSLSIKLLSLNPDLQKVVLTVTCTSYIMHIACPEQSASKEVLGEQYISDALLRSLHAQTWACIPMLVFYIHYAWVQMVSMSSGQPLDFL